MKLEKKLLSHLVMVASVRLVVLMRLLMALRSGMLRTMLRNLFALLGAIVLVRLVASTMALALGMMGGMTYRYLSVILVLLRVIRRQLTNMMSHCIGVLFLVMVQLVLGILLLLNWLGCQHNGNQNGCNDKKHLEELKHHIEIQLHFSN